MKEMEARKDSKSMYDSGLPAKKPDGIEPNKTFDYN